MNLFEESLYLLDDAQGQLELIDQMLDKSIKNKKIDSKLHVRIKLFLDSLRSALDYTAFALLKIHCPPLTKHIKCYFPYAQKSWDIEKFRPQIEKNLPGLTTSRPDIARKLESYQHFSHYNNSWLPSLIKRNNGTKHIRFEPAAFVNEPRAVLTTQNGLEMVFAPGATIKVIGGGPFLRQGDNVIEPANEEGIINLENPPKITGPGSFKVVAWETFRFIDDNEEVSDFLHRCLNGVSKIVGELSSR